MREPRPMEIKTMPSEPIWCDVKGAFCYCQERCLEEDYEEDEEFPAAQSDVQTKETP